MRNAQLLIGWLRDALAEYRQSRGISPRLSDLKVYDVEVILTRVSDKIDAYEEELAKEVL